MSRAVRVEWATLFDKMVESVACYERDGTIAYANPVTCQILGRPCEELVGQLLWLVFPEARGSAFHRAFERVARTGETQRFLHYHAPWARWYDNQVYLADGRVWVIARDVTDERRASSRLQLLSNASRVFAQAAADPHTSFEGIARHVAELIGDMCSIRLLSEDGRVVDAPLGSWDADPELRKLLRSGPAVITGEAVGTLLESGEPLIYNGLQQLELAEAGAAAAWRARIAELGIHSAMVVPLRADGRVLGMLSVARRKLGTRAPYAEEDVELLQELADRAALVVNQWRALERVEDSRRLLVTIADALPVLVCLVDDQLRYRFVNAMYERWFGRGREQLIGKSLEEVLGAEAFAAVEPNVRAALAGNELSFEASVPYAVAGTRHIRSTNTPYRVDGKVRGYIALVQDISLEKAHEAQLQRWEQLFQHAGWGVAMTEPGTQRLLAVNPAFARMHGYTVSELIGRPLTDCIAPESRSELARGDAAGSNGHHQYEAVHLRKDESRFPCLTESSEFRDESGKVSYLAANFQDITERKRDEAELRAAIATRDEFLSIASHELRTPLTALSLQLEGLERALGRAAASPEREAAARKVGMALRQADRLASLIEGLLNVSRIANGSFQLDLERFDVTDLVQEVVQRFEEEAQRVGSAVSVHVPAELWADWDRSRVDQALTNLLANAIKYGAGKPIDVSVRDAGESVCVAVRDRGIGLAPEDRQRVLGRFERAVPASHYGGLGLGLYIADQIARAHGGAIQIDSQPGRGATFTLCLPRRASEGEQV